MDHSRKRLLVVGAMEGSLGQAIAMRAQWHGFEVEGTVHLATEVKKVPVEGNFQDHHLDATVTNQVSEFFYDRPDFDSVIYAAGVNEQAGIWSGGPLAAYNARDHMEVNYVGAMQVLASWLSQYPHEFSVENHFVTISSNSAHIPRTKSFAYCASKAAVSMGMRCAARDQARMYPKAHPQIYVYEPGYIGNTSGSEVSMPEDGSLPTRMEGYGGLSISKWKMADMIVMNMVIGMTHLNGCCLKIDAGEQ